MYYKGAILFYFACLIAASYQQNNNLKFRLSTSYDRQGLRLLTSENVEKGSINVLKRVIIIIPDFESDLTEYYDQLRNEYFEKDNYNIFTVERSTGEKDSKTLGEEVANFIAVLMEKTGEKFLDIHVIAYSKGAEIASYAAKAHSEKHGRKIGRITALNPVSDQDGDSVIDVNDAKFVDVVHTDILDGKIKHVSGGIDFYPNGGEKQPGCDDNSDKSGTTSCNGIRSVEYFTKSVNSDKLKGANCPSWDEFKSRKCVDKEVVFGENVEKTASGTYYFQTDDKLNLLSA